MKFFYTFFLTFFLTSTVFAQSKMILIKGAAFLMGSPESERMRDKDERQHSVTISDFYCDAFEVSQKDYEKITGKNPSYNKGENLPVENVNFYDALEYCNKKSVQEGFLPVYKIQKGVSNFWDVTLDTNANGYRLLSEAEWEYACRGGTTTIFNTGNYNNPKDANYEGSYPYLIEENYVRRTNSNVQPGQNRGRTISVDSLAPNAFGLYNMHGNVSEWVFDYYAPYGTEKQNPLGAVTGTLRVKRGGGYNDFGKHLRSAYRSALNPLTKDRNLGFRIARNAGTALAAGTKTNAGIFETKYDEKTGAIKIPQNPRILVTYFSYSGNTQNAATYIAQSLKAKYGDARVDLVEMEMQNPYRGGIYDASQKDLMSETRVPLKTKYDISKYDVILLGYPTWWATLPMPVVTFLENYDFSGKTIISFSSHGGTIFGDSVSDLSKLAKGTYVGLPFEFYYGGGKDLEKRIDEWLKTSGL